MQGRRGLLLGDDTCVSGLHQVGMETERLDCLHAMIETPGCQNSAGAQTSCPPAVLTAHARRGTVPSSAVLPLLAPPLFCAPVHGPVYPLAYPLRTEPH